MNDRTIPDLGRPTREQFVAAEELVEMIAVAVTVRVMTALVDAGVVRPGAFVIEAGDASPASNLPLIVWSH